MVRENGLHANVALRESVLMQILKILFLQATIWMCVQACSDGKCQLGDGCTVTSNCAMGLYCSNCSATGDFRLTCYRDEATNVTSIRNGLPFNKYSWLTTHNSYAIVGEPSQTGVRVTYENQEDSVTNQLNNGVRGLMLDMYDFLGDVWLCHSFGGVCYNFTAFEPAIDTLKEIEAFLSANPTEIVTIFIEDYVHATKGLTRVFTAAGLMKYWFPVSSMPKSGGDWPTVTEMVANNERLLVFSSIESKEADEGIAYQWRYLNENQYGNGGMKAGYCPSRSESAALNNATRSLILENFFPDDPSEQDACKYNSEMLQQMLGVCYKAAGNRWANFLAVDFYKRSDGGGAFQALDTLNAGLLCGCSDLNACQLGNAYGDCTLPPVSGPNAATMGRALGSHYVSTSNSNAPNEFVYLRAGCTLWLCLLLVAWFSL